MYPLLDIFSSALPQSDLMAAAPDWTRASFNRTAAALSCRLKSAGVRSAALWFDDAALFACAVLAAWHAGAEVLLPPNLARDNVSWGGGADIWLTDVPHEAAFSDGISAHRVWDMAGFAAQGGRMPSENGQDAADPFGGIWQIAGGARALLYTSGSSGAAQAVVKTAAQMAAEAAALAQVVPFQTAQAAVIGSVSPQHMYGFTFRFALSLSMGWCIERPQHRYPETLLGAAARYPESVWIASPAVLNRLGGARDWAAVAGRVAGIVSAGSALPEDTAKMLAQHAAAPFEIYGSTETGVAAWRQHTRLWQPVPGAVLTQNGEGALRIESPWTGGIIQTADIAEASPSGFALLGRADRIIKLEDKRVSLSQMEHGLLRHEWVADAHCARHPQYGRVAAWTALNSDGTAALRNQGRAAVADALKRHLAAEHDAAALPRYWRFAETLPRNAQSKISAADFQTAFTQAQTAPQWQMMPSETSEPSASLETCRFQGRVPLDLAYFGGHFAGFPLVPGVVELQWVRGLAERFAWGRRSVVRVENLKYQQFVRPGDTVSAELKYDAEKDKLTFRLENGEAVCASGRMVFGDFEAV